MPQEGEKISEYTLEKLLGRGGFGEVWMARHAFFTDKVVAIKLLTNKKYLKYLMYEAISQHKLNHPNIVKCIGANPHHIYPYIILEYVDGKSLRQILKEQGRLTCEQTGKIFLQILSALKHAHQRGIYHLDLKPENILIEKDGFVKLTDFGLLDHTKVVSDYVHLSMEFERDGVILGSLNYMSPEQKENRGVDARSDIYSAGIILFEMLTGSTPKGAEKPSQIHHDIPEIYDRVFLKCFCRLEHRYTDVDQIIKDLTIQEAILEEAPSKTMTKCPFCAEQIPFDTKTCPYCELALFKICPFCNSEISAIAKKCRFCGKDVDRKRPRYRYLY
jgi:serine/threonine protein kinase